MVVKYNDPYGKREYAQLKGDKSDAFFTVKFDEASIYKTDDWYTIYGFFTEYQGVVRSFKPENPITPSVTALPIYGQEYEVRKKDKDGNWSSDKLQPSAFEAALFKHIAANEATLVGEEKTFSGHVTHMPNAMCGSYQGQQMSEFIVQNISFVVVEKAGKVPAFNPPSSGGQRKSGGWGRGISPEEKVVFLVKQLTEDIKHVDWKSGKTLAELTDQMILEHQANPNFIEIYFDMLIACVR